MEMKGQGLTQLDADRSKIDQKVAHALILKAACRIEVRRGGGNVAMMVNKREAGQNSVRDEWKEYRLEEEGTPAPRLPPFLSPRSQPTMHMY